MKQGNPDKIYLQQLLTEKAIHMKSVQFHFAAIQLINRQIKLAKKRLAQK